MTGFAFYAIGTPAAQGSKRHIGNGVMIESSTKVKPWRKAIIDAAPAVEGPLEGPLIARIVFTVARPVSAKKTAKAPHTRPDLDKYLRSTFDAISDLKLWHDDSQVCDFERLAKVWWGYDDEAMPVPGVVIAVCPMGEWNHHWQLRTLTTAAAQQAFDRLRRQEATA